MWNRILLCVAVITGAAGLLCDAAPAPSTVAAAGPSLPAGWAAGLDKAIAGVTPLATNLWEGDPPGLVATTRPERDDGTGRIWDVSVPGMLVYLPPRMRPSPRRRGRASSSAQVGRTRI